MKKLNIFGFFFLLVTFGKQYLEPNHRFLDFSREYKLSIDGIFIVLIFIASIYHLGIVYP
jgi:hypothetical protein